MSMHKLLCYAMKEGTGETWEGFREKGGREDNNNNKIFCTRDIDLEAKALRACLHYIELRKTMLFL